MTVLALVRTFSEPQAEKDTGLLYLIACRHSLPYRPGMSQLIRQATLRGASKECGVCGDGRCLRGEAVCGAGREGLGALFESTLSPTLMRRLGKDIIRALLTRGGR
jgi:hypothetical protein